jgi:hypothetical protein
VHLLASIPVVTWGGHPVTEKRALSGEVLPSLQWSPSSSSWGSACSRRRRAATSAGGPGDLLVPLVTAALFAAGHGSRRWGLSTAEATPLNAVAVDEVATLIAGVARLSP